MAPSTSLSPTETCYWIEIEIVYDDYPSDIFWRLEREGDDWIETIKEHQASNGDTSHVESFCLQEGSYWFSIRNIGGGAQGICCVRGQGHYNVTAPDGTLIVEGGHWIGLWEQTFFSIPFVPGTSMTIN